MVTRTRHLLRYTYSACLVFSSDLTRTFPAVAVMPAIAQTLRCTFIYYYWYSALRPVWAETRVQSGDWYVRCILGKFLGVACHCFPPLFRCSHFFTTRCLHVCHDVRDPSGGRWNCGRECFPDNFAEMTTSTPFRDLLHAANLQHGTDGFTSPPKEGVLRTFSPLKIRRLRPGLNPRTWVLKAS